MTRNGYYAHSGEFPLWGVGVGLATGLLGVALLAAPFAYLELYIPLAGFISFVLAGGYGLLVGGATGIGLSLGHVRNRAVGFGIAALVSAAALYAAWAVWVYAALRQAEVEDVSLLALLLGPGGLATIVGLINENGAWSLSGFTPTGGVLWALWGAEALLVAGAALVVALAAISGPYCERCHGWCKEIKDVARLPHADVEELKRRLEAKDLAYLERLNAAEGEPDRWLRLDLHVCESCRDLHTLSAQAVTLKVNEKGQSSEDTTELVRHLLITASEAESVRGLRGEVVPDLARLAS